MSNSYRFAWVALCSAIFTGNLACQKSPADNAPAANSSTEKPATHASPSAPSPDKSAVPPANVATNVTDETQHELYTLPVNPTVADLLSVIDKIESFRPTSRPQGAMHMRRAPDALREAAIQILALENNKNSPASIRAQGILLFLQAGQTKESKPATLLALSGEILAYCEANGIEPRQMPSIANMLRKLEYADEIDVAAAAYEKIGQLMAKSKHANLQARADSMIGAARRLRLPGNPIEISGNTLDGKPFDFASLRGKIVLVDFWATWCGPCLEELPNVLENYRRFHDQGFEVVGISIDDDRKRLTDFLAENQLPWPTLFEPEAGWNNPNIRRYGISGIPTVILVDKQGNVISIAARGPTLTKLLEKHLGSPAGPKESAPAAEKPIP